MLSPYTRRTGTGLARHLKRAVAGVIAKRLDGPYEPGKRAMIKMKKWRTADCVVGGFRYERNSRLVGSLLLGLYNNRGKLVLRLRHKIHPPFEVFSANVLGSGRLG